jgi:hypothetical protein
VTTTTVASDTVDGTVSSTSSEATGGRVVGGADDSSASLEQTISVSILPGPLTISPTSESVAFFHDHGHGRGGPYAGSVTSVTVVDARGSLVGWNATVTLESVSGLDSAQLAHARLCVSPDPVTVVAGNPPEVRSGAHSCGGVGEPLTLFDAPPNGGGGTFSDTGALTLLLPGTAAGNQVTAALSVGVH